MQFSCHGIYEVKVEDGILFVDATGPFNEELINSYRQAIEKCIQIVEAHSWNQIIVLHDMSLFTPEAELALTESLINRKSRKLNASAVVFVDIEGEIIIKQQMSKAYNTAKVQHEYFTSIEEAKIWLQSLN